MLDGCCSTSMGLPSNKKLTTEDEKQDMIAWVNFGVQEVLGERNFKTNNFLGDVQSLVAVNAGG